MTRAWLRTAVTVMAMASAVQPVAAQASGRTVYGTVYDSLESRPLAAARVMLLPRSDSMQTTRSVAADSDGRFQLSGVASGVYLIGFEHPLLDSLGITARPRQIQLAPTGAPVQVDLAVPSAATVHDALCPGRPASDSSSVLIGHLSDASTRGVIGSGIVHASWVSIARTEHNVAVLPARDSVQAGQDGSFVLCDLPAGQPVVVVATAGVDSSGVLNVVPPAGRGVLRHELYLGRGDEPRTGQITGYVQDANTKTPISGASVIINGTPLRARTGSGGEFAFNDLRYGTLTLSISRSGFVARQQPVDVLVGAPATVTIGLLSQAAMQDTTVAMAARSVAETSGFYARRAKYETQRSATARDNMGSFFDYEALKQLHYHNLSELVAHRLGLVIPDTGNNRPFERVTDHSECAPSFYSEGIHVPVVRGPVEMDETASLGNIAAVEIYDGPRPPFPPEADPNSCGFVLVWMLPPAMRHGHGRWP